MWDMVVCSLMYVSLPHMSLIVEYCYRYHTAVVVASSAYNIVLQCYDMIILPVAPVAYQVI